MKRSVLFLSQDDKRMVELVEAHSFFCEYKLKKNIIEFPMYRI